MKIPVSSAQKIRESLGVTHLVIFAVDKDGVQHVATAGGTEKEANQAAEAGNNLKTSLGWPAELCNSKPIQRICKNCAFYKPDYGYHCFNGWTKDGSDGECEYDPTSARRYVTNTSKCSKFAEK